jgi:hypothetical protein
MSDQNILHFTLQAVIFIGKQIYKVTLEHVLYPVQVY